LQCHQYHQDIIKITQKRSLPHNPEETIAIPLYGSAEDTSDPLCSVQASAKNPNDVVSVQLKIQIKTKCQIFVSVETKEIIVQQK
jgi:hypothetical protein